ncbi:type IV conjugative transfer system protein TraL [Ideonella sp. YS5]|uniref:type IV conjugative transfer system protein TraL n=1 Tax=Ideonella sp. YS5 TaxID=3453714 RepID=UPI003EE92AAB
MDEDQDCEIVARLNEPMKFIFVDMDIAVLCGAVFLTMLMSGLPTFIDVAIPGGIGYLLHKSRQDKPRGYVKHWLYWYMPPMVLPMRCVPPMHCVRTAG